MRMILSVLLVFLLACEVQELAEPLSAKEEMLLVVNAVRKEGCKCGNTWYPPVPPLKWNGLLEQIASKHSEEMANKNFFSHIDKNGLSPDKRMEQNGYPWTSFGENLFLSTDPKHGVRDAVEAWKKSPGHCENLMKDYFTEMGMAVYKGYYTQLLGSR